MSFKLLVNALSEQRQEIKQALTLFPYFDTWDSEVIEECCQLSKIIEFAPDEIILGAGSTSSHMTFFILEGICKIIHHLLVHIKVDSYGRKTYTLYKPEEPGTLNSRSNQGGYVSLLFNNEHFFQKEEQIAAASNRRKSVNPTKEGIGGKNIGKILSTEQDNENETMLDENDIGGTHAIVVENPESQVEEGDEKDTGKYCQTEEKATDEPEVNENSGDRDDGNRKIEDKSQGKAEKKEFTAKSSLEKKLDGLTKDKEDPEHPESPVQEKREKNEAEQKERKETENSKKINEWSQKDFESEHHLKVLENCREKSRHVVRLMDENFLPKKPENVKSFFVQVALFYKGACFGLEENFKNTFFMSATKVKCLRIPSRFLFQHNPCNIWNRIRLFFNLYLPPEKQILEYVKSQRAWNNMKRKKSVEITAMKRIPNYILASEVPFSIRLREMPLLWD